MESQPEINEREWRDPKNWRGGLLGIYHSECDDRAVVPKRNPWFGVTFNVGHPVGRALTLVTLFVVVAAIAWGI